MPARVSQRWLTPALRGDIILDRERHSRLTALPEDVQAGISEQEIQRLQSHIAALQNAAIPLKRVEVKEE